MYTEREDSSRDNPFNLNDRNFRIAFTFEQYTTKKLMNDPRYVRWIFRIAGTQDNVYNERILPYHKCTDEDYA